MAIVTAAQVEAEWDALAALPEAQIRARIAAFEASQSTICEFILAHATDPYRPAMSVTMHLALTIDEIYARRLPPRLLCVNELEFGRAQGEVAIHMACVDFKSGPILPPLLRRCRIAEPHVATILAHLIYEEHDETRFADIVGDIMIGLTVLLAYQYANRSNLRVALRGRLSDGLLPPVQRPAPKARQHSFAKYLEVLGFTMAYYSRLKHDPIATTHRAEFDDFDRQYCRDDLMEIFCSLQMGYFLFDRALDGTELTVAEHLLSMPESGLWVRQRVRLQHWTDSHIGIYEVVRQPNPLVTELRDLVTGTLWIAHELEHPVAHDLPRGSLVLTRLLGPPGKALMPSVPFLCPDGMRQLLIDFAYELMETVDPSLDLERRYHLAMRGATPVLAETIKAIIDQAHVRSSAKPRPLLRAVRRQSPTGETG